MSSRDDEWKRLYDELSRSLKTLGTENPYGEADYWLVDDDYGDAAHKLCVHRPMFLQPALITAVQRVLEPFPQWRVMLQIEFPIDGVPHASSGLIIYPGAIEEHWDRRLVPALVRQLGL